MAESEAHEFLGHLVPPAGVCGFLAIRGAKESQDPQKHWVARLAGCADLCIPFYVFDYDTYRLRYLRIYHIYIFLLKY